MADEPEQPQQPQRPPNDPEENKNTPTEQPTNFQQGVCPECKTPMAFRAPNVGVFNSVTVSIIAISHERFDRCPNCHAVFVPQVMGVNPQNNQILFMLSKLQGAKAGSTLIEGTQSNMARALSMDKIAKGMMKQ